MSDRPLTVSDLGESALLERITAPIGKPPDGELWAGDDAAVIRPRGTEILFTTDLMIEGVDFELRYCGGADIGWKAVAINASDVAAMGGHPTRAVATLALHPDTLVSVVDGIVEGVMEACREWGIGMAGGDLSQAGEMSIGMAMVGDAFEEPVRRTGAGAGDAICVTGSFGGAAGGLIALRRDLVGPGPTEGHSYPAGLRDALTRLAARHLRPRARVAEAEAIVRAGPTAMMDVSDGLAVDLHHLVSASRVGCEVDPASIPIDLDLDALSGALGGDAFDPVATAITGGEDFELLFTIPEDRLDAVDAGFVSRIGTVVQDGRRIGERDLEEWRSRGWEHLRNR